MWSAASVALVDHGRPVLQEPRARAVLATAAQLRVEGVEHIGVERTDLHVPDQRSDVLVRVAQVGCPRTALQRDQLEVPIEQLVDGGGGARVPPLVNLAGQPPRDLLSLGHRLRTGGHDLAEVVAPFAHRVDPGVHADPQRATRQFLDAPACPRTTSR
jgi:hypothetical protein